MVFKTEKLILDSHQHISRRRWYNGEHSCLPSNTCAISIPDLFVIAQALGLLSKCRFLPTLTKHLVNF